LLAGIGIPAQQITSPKAYMGKQIGADGFLANYTQLRGYWKKLASESDRMNVVNIGTTSYGQPMVMAVISSPANLGKVDEYREIAKTLALAKGLDDARAKALASKGKAVVWIDAGMHATESVAAQNILELVYRMVSGQDDDTLEILKSVILLVCPANPDGMEMVSNGYMATGRVGNLPVLYQKYIGHDNNRDYYMASQAETEAINRVLYRKWFPQIVYNHHQSAPRGTIIFTPPFRDPFNYNFDPMVVRGIALVANHISSRFSWESKPGAISRTGARYSTWWNGGLRTTTYFHNMIGILTESFGSPNPTKLTQSLRRRLPYGDYPNPVKSGLWHARQTIEYLQTANKAILLLASRYRKEFLYNIYQMGRNSIRRGSEDHWTPTPKLVAEARRRSEAARGAGRNTGDEQGEGERRGGRRRGGGRGRSAGAMQKAVEDTFTDPKLRDARSYVISAKQLDPSAARRFVGILIKAGVEVHKLTQAAVIGGKRYLPGSFVVKLAQAFRPHARDMFEPQWHPDDVGSGGDPVAPYDSAGWTPTMQMGVEFDRVFESFEASLATVTLESLARPTAGKVTHGRAGYLLRAGDSNSFTCINRLVERKEKVFCLRKDKKLGRHSFPKGTYFISRGKDTAAVVDTMAKSLGLDFFGVDGKPGVPGLALGPIRVGLFDVYGGNMATGWTQWLLEQHEFPVQLVFGDRVEAGDLRKDFDVLIFQTGLPDPGGRGRIRRALRRGRPNRGSDERLDSLVKALPPFEDWSNVKARRVRLTKEKAVPALKAFVTDGGVLVAVGSQSVSAARLFKLPVKDGVLVRDKETSKEREATRKEFFIPASLMRMTASDASMITTGIPSSLTGMFRRSAVFQVRDSKRVKVLLRFPETGGDLLASGWAIGAELLRGKAAALEATVGKGKVYLFGIDAVYRGQPQVTIKMLFNSILLGAARSVPSTEVK
jgi:hypothetical protein